MLKKIIDYIQILIDLHGDSWLALFTILILARIFLVLKGYPSLTNSEAIAYGTCVTAFAASNIGGPK